MKTLLISIVLSAGMLSLILLLDLVQQQPLTYFLHSLLGAIHRMETEDYILGTLFLLSFVFITRKRRK
ncbi:hypothetical protein [Ectobacillus polymachus]|uniref:hypothetical protein n=1 Tax=Ectobacillus polymachus TaxID=1508806 RepID=UPI003A8A2FCB